MKPFACLLVLLACLCGVAVGQNTLTVAAPKANAVQVEVWAEAVGENPTLTSDALVIYGAGYPEIREIPLTNETGRLSIHCVFQSVVPARSYTITASGCTMMAWVCHTVTITQFHEYDINHDGRVNVLDLIIVREALGTSDPNCDVNDDGIVDTKDLLVIRSGL